MDTTLQRIVAVKSLRMSGNQPEAISRMLYEAQAAAAVKHPHLIAIYDVVQNLDGLHLVMEWSDGVSLDEWFKRAPPLAEIVRLLVDVADAMHQVHLAGLVHCDLKPANILVDQHGYARVTDFGLAVREQSQAFLTGKVFGTPVFFSPEQVRGESHRLDGRTDIWALGVILYRALTTRMPFQGQTQSELFDEIEFRAVKPPRQIEAKVPADLEAICLKCLRKAPEDRYATAADLAAALRQADCLTKASTHTPVSVAQIPHASDRLIGRDDLVNDLSQRMVRSGQRLFTLTGPGGVGKTRIASAVAEQVLDHFEGQVVWVDLAEARSEEDVVRLIRTALGLQPPQGHESSQVIADALQLRDATLMVLDNCEQVVEVIAPLIAKWLIRAGQLTVLVTSQARLGIGSEQRVVIEPLSLPAIEMDTDGADSNQGSAIELFIARAAQAGTVVELTSANQEIVLEICRLLDGLPLALELAAARLPLLGLQGLLNKLRQSWDVLKTNRRDLPERQRTLAATVAWSVGLLDREEREVLRLLAAFPAALPVDFLEPLIETAFNFDRLAMELLQELEERSLLRRRECDGEIWLDLLSAARRLLAKEQAPTDQNAAWQFDQAMQAVVVRYALEYWQKRPLPTASAMRDAVAGHLWQLAEWCLALNDRPSAVAASCLADHIAADYVSASVRIARLRPLLATTSNAIETSLLLALGRAELASGNQREVLALLDNQAFDQAPSAEQAEANHLRGECWFNLSDYDAARNYLQTAIQQYQTAGIDVGAARSLAVLGRIAWRKGQLSEADAQFAQALVHAARVPNPSLRSELIRDQGNVLLMHGQPEEALQRFVRAERLALQAEDRRAVRQAVVSRAAALAELGDYAAADRLYVTAERLSRLLGDRRGLAMVQNNRALALIDRGQGAAALKVLDGASQLYREVDHTAGIAICLAAQGAAHLADGELALALQRFDQVLAELRPIAGSLHEAVVRIDRVTTLRRLGRTDGIDQELNAAWQLLEQMQATQSPEGFLCLAEQALFARTAIALEKANVCAEGLKLDERHPRLRLRQALDELREIQLKSEWHVPERQ